MNMVTKIISAPRPASQTFKQAREYAYNAFVSRGMSPDQAKEIERSILEYTKRECHLRNFKELRWSDVNIRRFYIRKLRMLVHNATDLLRLIKTGVVNCSDTASVDHQTLKPELWRPIIEKYENRRICTLISDSDVKYDGLLKCEECKGWNTRFVTFQTRSADEPMTVFATCMDCRTNWTQ